jgi:hypothetical protein
VTRSASDNARRIARDRLVTHRRSLILLALLLSAGAPAGAEETGDHQRIASYTPKPLTVSAEATVVVHPGSGRRIALGGAEGEIGLLLHDRWDVSICGMVPVDIVATPGEVYRFRRSNEVHAGVDAGVSFGPPHRQHRVGASADNQWSGGLNYTLFSIRDPLVQGIGFVVEVRRTADAVETTVSVPLSIALVANDVTAIHAKLIPDIVDVHGEPRGGLTAVLSVRWAWEQWNAGSAALFGQQGAPGGMALTGGWKWKRTE